MGCHHRERREPGLGKRRYKGAGGARGLSLVALVAVDLFWVAFWLEHTLWAFARGLRSASPAECLAKVMRFARLLPCT